MSVRARYLLTTLMFLAVAVAIVLAQGRAPRPGPRLEGPPVTVSRPGPLPSPPPSAAQILEWRESLALAAAQVARLHRLADGWVGESARLDAAVEAERSKFARFMDTQKGRAPLGEIERQSADLKEASAELRTARRRHSDEALAVLSESQRARLREALGADGRKS